MIQILKDQGPVKADIRDLKEGQIQLAMGQAELVTTTNELKEGQAKMMAMLLQIVDRLP